MDTNNKELNGVVAFFDNPHALIEATKKVKAQNYEEFDCFTPFPVHGLDQAQGLKRSPLPYVTFLAGVGGCSIGFGLQYFTSVMDWPLIVGGKPFNSWPAFVPVMFELTVLLAALTTVGAMFAINGLPNVNKKIIDPSLTRDRFALWVAKPKDIDPENTRALAKRSRFKGFNESEVSQFLKGLGAIEVRSTYQEGWF